MEYLLEDVIAARQVNLIAGGSGSGKTRWIFQLQHAIKEQGKLLGYRAHHARWGYISGDRTCESIRETLETMGLVSRVPIYSCVDENTVGRSIPELWPKVCDVLGVVPELLVIDGFTSFCPNGKINDYDVVAKWLAGLQGFCQREHVAILGACHTTKAKANQEITDPRQQIAGSVAWAAYSEGMVVIHKPHQGGEKDPWRDIYMCGRNSGMNLIKAQFSTQGWLEEREGEREKVHATDLILEDALRPGSEHKSSDLEKLAVAGGVSRATFQRWLSEKKEKGLFLGGKGKVVVPWPEVGEESIQ